MMIDGTTRTVKASKVNQTEGVLEVLYYFRRCGCGRTDCYNLDCAGVSR